MGSRRVLLTVALLLLGLVASAAATAATAPRPRLEVGRLLTAPPAAAPTGDVARTARPARARVRAAMGDPAGPLRFGVYPWGGVGAVGDVAGSKADDPTRAMAAARALRGDKELVVHLYGAYTGTDADAIDRLVRDARWWSDNGMGVEMVLRYRPARTTLADGYAAWVREASARLARIRGVVAIQVGNEANMTDSPDAGDGAYAGAVRAIAKGAPAARAATTAAGRGDIGIGFNWAAGARPCTTEAFWRSLRSTGGGALRRSVDWVGVDVYPGTWSAPSASSAPSSRAVARTVTDTLKCLRRKHIPAAGLSPRTTITVAETGYPTDARRSEAAQSLVLTSVVRAVQRVRQRYGVTDLRWFALRDANTASGEMENGYGLLRDDYTAKPAFDAYRRIIASSGR